MTQDFHTEKMLEAFLMGHLPEARHVEMARAITLDASLAQAVAEKKASLGLMHALLEAGQQECDEEELDSLLLARYLDDSLSASEKQQLETRLAGSAALQQQLISLYRETKIATDPDTVIETVAQRPAGETSAFAPAASEESGEGSVSEKTDDNKANEAAG